MEDILQWLASGKDYQEGVAILDRHTKSSALIRHFRCTTAKFAAAKLEYELRKLLKGRAAALGSASLLSRPAAPVVVKQMITTPEPVAEKRPGTAVPDIIAQAKSELYELFTAISIAHRNLYELGEGNSQDVVARRRRILQERLPLIRRYERLYLLKEQYFDTGKVPEELVRLIEDKVREEPAETVPHRTEFEALSDIDLVKKQHSLKVNINKTRNRLEYQALKKLATPNPMPDSSLRSRLEARLECHDLSLNFDDHQHSHAVIAYRYDPSILEPYPVDSTAVAQYDERLDRVRLYPNPAADHITIESSEDLLINAVAVTNLAGQLLFIQPVGNARTEVNVRTLSSGTYIVHFNTRAGSVERKFVVKR